MTDAVASDHCAESLVAGLQAQAIIPGEAGYSTASNTYRADPTASQLSGFLSAARALALWRNAVLAVLGGLVWILAVSVLMPRESLSALSAVFVAATISSVAGFAFSAVAGGMLLHMVDNTVRVVMIMMACSIAIQSLSVALLWRDIDWRRLSTFLFGGIIGLPVGVWLLLHLDPRAFKSVMGALLIAYATYSGFKRPVSVRSGNAMWDVLTGCLGGITGGLAGFPGAAVTIWCGMQGWNKRRQRAIYQPYILFMQVLGLLSIHVLHPAASTGNGASDILPFIPGALLGAWIGLKIFERLSENHFKFAVNVLLFVSGVGLIV
jgi:uncharacterized membrane protein YfcA